MKQAIAYVRVSTKGQGESGFGFEAQRAQIEAYAQLAGYRIVKTVSETASAMGKGSLSKRPKLREALKEAHDKRLTIIVADLTRLSRHTETVEKLLALNVAKIVAANLDPSVNTITLQSEAARAQREGEMIGERTRKALAQKKLSGMKLGNRTNLSEAQAKGCAENARVAGLRLEELRDHIAQVRAEGSSTASGIAAALNARGIKAARGGPWGGENVRRVQRQLKLKPAASAPPEVPPEPVFTPDGRVTASGKIRLEKALSERDFSVGDLMRELGYKPLDASLGTALSCGRKIHDGEKISKIVDWLGRTEAPPVTSH